MGGGLVPSERNDGGRRSKHRTLGKQCAPRENFAGPRHRPVKPVARQHPTKRLANEGGEKRGRGSFRVPGRRRVRDMGLRGKVPGHHQERGWEGRGISQGSRKKNGPLFWNSQLLDRERGKKEVTDEEKLFLRSGRRRLDFLEMGGGRYTQKKGKKKEKKKKKKKKRKKRREKKKKKKGKGAHNHFVCRSA